MSQAQIQDQTSQTQAQVKVQSRTRCLELRPPTDIEKIIIRGVLLAEGRDADEYDVDNSVIIRYVERLEHDEHKNFFSIVATIGAVYIYLRRRAIVPDKVIEWEIAIVPMKRFAPGFVLRHETAYDSHYHVIHRCYMGWCDSANIN